MGKKCIPGVLCVENMTLLILIIVIGIIAYLYYTNQSKNLSNIYIVSPANAQLSGHVGQPITLFNSGSQDTLNDAYSPPLKNDGVFFRGDSGDIRGQPMISNQPTPINIQTRGFNPSYTQVGILTRTSGGDMILPLMGRRIMNGRSKMQYYTISNTGSLNTKLPVSVNGRSCTGEYGCDEISNGDTIYVEGYNNTFRATVYENGMFSYLP